MTKTIREAVAVFHSEKNLEQAVLDLEEHGFDRAEISLLASESAVEEKLGHRYARVEEMEDDPEAPRSAFVSRESMAEGKAGLVGGLFYVGAVAASGAVVATAGTALAAVFLGLTAGGVGALIGGLLASLIGDQHALHMQEQLTRGGLVLWVNLRDQQHEERAVEILRTNGGEQIHVHDIAA